MVGKTAAWIVFAAQALCRSVAVAGPGDAGASMQVAAGAAAYAEHCASCHGEALSGTTHAPGLKGDAFWTSWADKTARLLYGRIISTMPLTDPGTLEPKVAMDITTFILSANKQSVPAAGYKSADELNSIPIKRLE